MRKTKQMLRIVLLLLAVGCMASCTAQPGRDSGILHRRAGGVFSSDRDGTAGLLYL